MANRKRSIEEKAQSVKIALVSHIPQVENLFFRDFIFSTYGPISSIDPE